MSIMMMMIYIIFIYQISHGRYETHQIYIHTQEKCRKVKHTKTTTLKRSGLLRYYYYCTKYSQLS